MSCSNLLGVLRCCSLSVCFLLSLGKTYDGIPHYTEGVEMLHIR